MIERVIRSLREPMRPSLRDGGSLADHWRLDLLPHNQYRQPLEMENPCGRISIGGLTRIGRRVNTRNLSEGIEQARPTGFDDGAAATIGAMETYVLKFHRRTKAADSLTLNVYFIEECALRARMRYISKHSISRSNITTLVHAV